MPKITKILARELLDSRGNPSVEATVFTKNNRACASVPSGSSTGKNEAVELRDGGTRYLGMGVLKAVKNVKGPIAKRLIGRDVCEQEFIDEALIHLDGTPNKKRLGTNAILAVSMACARLGAEEKGQPLFRYLMKSFGLRNAKIPRPFFNIINGGKHAGNDLAIQEYMISPKARKFSESLRKGSEVYHVLKKRLAKKYGKQAVNVGDEGGFAPQMKCIDAPLDEIMNAALEFTYANDIKLAIDAAATSFYTKSRYLVEGGFKTKG